MGEGGDRKGRIGLFLEGSGYVRYRLGIRKGGRGF